MDNQQFPLIASSASGIRASEAERERMSQLLRRHHLDGRLDGSEFQDRLERCLQARTLGELRALALDLPLFFPAVPLLVFWLRGFWRRGGWNVNKLAFDVRSATRAA